jgi:mannitol/fructose-specific phosphotransferase system IIA component (Ntr-type)
VEEKYQIAYTDYSFKMLSEYLCIQLFRMKMGNVITEPVYEEKETIVRREVVQLVAEMLEKEGKITVNPFELQYIDVLFASASVQAHDDTFKILAATGFEKTNKQLGIDMMRYLSEILNVNLLENELLMNSLDSFLPSSLIRTKYGIEVVNPFLGDIREMYSGIFATCFTIGKFYEQYCQAIPTDQEIAFLALFVGGALHRNEKTVKAILIGTSGIAAANIVAKKIENMFDDVQIVAILSPERAEHLEEYEFDIILSMANNFEYGRKVVHISPVISKTDEKNIRDKCFEVLSHPEQKRDGFTKLIDTRHIMFINEKLTQEAILEKACTILCKDGYVNKDFFESVISRENIEPTAIGNGVAIPHGRPENVCHPKVFVIRLSYPVNWGSKMVDTIFLLALNFNNIATTKAFFHDFARILGSEDKIGKIRETKDIAEMEKTLKSELHWV